MFDAVAKAVADWTGRPQAFCAAVGAVALWAVTGPLFGYSDTWQLVINTSTTIVTFWMVFLLQYAQNADTAALHLKADEILRCMPSPESDRLVDIERRPRAEVDEAKRRIVEGS